MVKSWSAALNDDDGDLKKNKKGNKWPLRLRCSLKCNTLFESFDLTGQKGRKKNIKNPTEIIICAQRDEVIKSFMTISCFELINKFSMKWKFYTHLRRRRKNCKFCFFQ